MTIVWLVVAGLASLAGTRMSALLFIAAGASSAAYGGAVGTIGAFAAWSAAGLVIAGVPARKFAPSALGTAAVLMAGSAPNAAVVLPLWLLATASVLSLPGQLADRRRLFYLLVSDVPFAVGMAIASAGGFISWRTSVPSAAVLGFAAAAAAKLPLTWSNDHQASNVVVRSQLFVALALAADGPQLEVKLLVIAGALAFAGGGLLSGQRRDSLQEAGLAALVLGGVVYGLPSGWLWAVLLGGAVLRLGRFSDAQSLSKGWGWPMVASGGFGAVWWPVAAAVIGSAIWTGGLRASLVVIALPIGLIVRAWPDEPDSGHAPAVAWVVIAVGLAAGLWATFGLNPANWDTPTAWPPALALLMPVAGVAAALWFPGLAPFGVKPVTRHITLPDLPSLPHPTGRFGPLALAICLFAAAGYLFIMGLTRGFL